MTPEVRAFFDHETFTATYVVHDPATKKAAIIDSVLDFDAAAARTSTQSARAVIDYAQSHELTVDWVLETHIHADHLTAAPYLQEKLGGKTAIGAHAPVIQKKFAEIFNAEPAFARDGRQFDKLFSDGENFSIGEMEARVMHVPGHTPACVAYVIGNAAFVGDTLFMPDYGTARCDFPGGDARALYRSIQKIFALPDEMRVFVCHDYKAPERDHFAWESSIAEHKADNIHIHAGVSEDAFVKMREARDKTLGMPRLILPAVQVNMRAGAFPPPENNGAVYLKLPVDRF